MTCIFAINKADAGVQHESSYRELWQEVSAAAPDPPASQWITISARTGLGIPKLLSQLFAVVPPGPQLFPENVLTDFPRRWNISDIVREKLFTELYAELPHDLGVGVNDIIETADHWDVYVTLYVNRPTQKGIVIGHKGRLLRKVRRQAEKELKEMYGLPVKLELWVKVEKNWTKNFWILRELGYQ